MSSRERFGASFDRAVEAYERARPRYPSALFDILAEAGQLRAGSRVLEIGPGTGQATRDLAARGCSIVAVERGAALAERARNELAGFPNVEVVTAAFEDWPLPTEAFDCVLAATSFHWLDPAVRVTKSAAALRPGGVLATIATIHIAGGTQAFFEASQACYERWDPATEEGLRLPAGAAVASDPEPLSPELFETASFHRHEQEIDYTSAEYLALLQTYSGHIELPPRACRSARLPARADRSEP